MLLYYRIFLVKMTSDKSEVRYEISAYNLYMEQFYTNRTNNNFRIPSVSESHACHIIS